MNGLYGGVTGYNEYTEWDKCIECDVFRVKDKCEHCGEGVCSRKNCCQVFPHKEKTKFIICNSCSSDIEDKLVLVINYDELRLLKQKISQKIAQKIKEIDDKK
jgi:hypothetical protein